MSYQLGYQLGVVNDMLPMLGLDVGVLWPETPGGFAESDKVSS
jgi:hypothetical protein